MTDIIMEHLKAIRNDQAAMKRTLDEHTLTLVDVSENIAALHTDNAAIRLQLVGINERLEHLETASGLV